jgi:hypothetical protein
MRSIQSPQDDDDDDDDNLTVTEWFIFAVF